MRVLVTGAAGAIGKPVSELLQQRGHTVRRFDRLPCGGDEIIADIANPDAVLAACADMDAVVHLAATPDRAPFLELVPPNVVGVFNVLDAARQHGMRRVVLASTVQVSWSGGPTEKRTTIHSAPRNHYALMKLWAEEMGAMYAREFALSVIAARIGWMVRDEREGLDMRARNMKSHYISRGDVAHFMACAVETPNVQFGVFYAMGPGGADAYDLDSPQRALGYEPRDHFPAGLPFTLPPEDR